MTPLLLSMACSTILQPLDGGSYLGSRKRVWWWTARVTFAIHFYTGVDVVRLGFEVLERCRFLECTHI